MCFHYCFNHAIISYWGFQQAKVDESASIGNVVCVKRFFSLGRDSWHSLARHGGTSAFQLFVAGFFFQTLQNQETNPVHQSIQSTQIFFVCFHHQPPNQPKDKDSRPSTPVTIPSLPGNLTFLWRENGNILSQSQQPPPPHHHHHHHHHQQQQQQQQQQQIMYDGVISISVIRSNI